MEIILHIGVPKTGSSAIQSHLNTNRGWFARRGVYVPRAGYSPGSGHNFLFGQVEGASIPRPLRNMLPADGALPALFEELRDSERLGCERVLLSWEGFAHLDEALMESFKQQFSSVDITVLAYVREQSKLRQSSILQAIKVGRTVKSVFSFQDDEYLAADWSMDYLQLLSRWRRVFGEDAKIKTRIYDRSILVDGDVIADFIQWLGLELDDAFAQQVVEVNPSLDFSSAAVLAMARAAGLDARGASAMSRALSAAIHDQVSNAGVFLPASTINRIRSNHASSNRQFLASFPPENELGTDDSLLLPGLIIEEESPPDGIAVFARSVFDALQDRTPRVWHGEKLSHFALARVSSEVGPGWRLPEKGGIWALGSHSEIAFRLPPLSVQEPPRALVLKFTGVYTQGVEQSVLRINGLDQTCDLRAAVVQIPIDGPLLEQGVRLEIRHDDVLPDSGAQEESTPIYKLRALAYDWQ